ncbi:hypothetical protein D7Y56_01005 (plasmid) [Streptomyces sp. S501]|uniref:DUF7224 domain-containing protein n=1 Tax=Streptomyces sp. S501 TaxID=2420135 RepID=UPI00106EBC61|nr:hypothetical protein [Streptomyces sp. S501]QBR04632.1 hypothetical protein D7Y56_01005 [Streptomyces sp. S501]
MRISTLLRSGPAAWAALVLVPVLVWFSAQNTESTIAYWPSISSQTTIVVGFISAACGAGAAWEAARLRQGGITVLAPARGSLSVAVLHLGPVAVLGLIAMIAPFAVIVTSVASTPGLPNPAILAVSYSVVLAHIALGWFVGARMPKLLGAATMLIFGYLWGFWPAALGGLPWLRHLNGQGVTECCGLDQDPSIRSLAATVTFSLAIVAAVVLSSALSHRLWRPLLSLTGFTVATTVALTLAVPLDFQGTQARDTALRTCTGQNPQICLWPEQNTRRADISHWAEETTAQLSAVGVTPARQVEFGDPQPDKTNVASNIATSPLPNEAPPCALRQGAAYPGDEAMIAIYAWLSLTGGVPKSDLAQRWPLEAISLAEQIRALPTQAQHAWYERNMRSVHDCAVLPDLDPASYTKAATS